MRERPCMAKTRKRASPLSQRQNGLVGRSQDPILDADVVSIWTEGLDLLDAVLGMLSDANLRPGRDDSLISRGKALALGHTYSRQALNGLGAGLTQPACRLIRDQFRFWRQV